jgi:hypothetical protein
VAKTRKLALLTISIALILVLILALQYGQIKENNLQPTPSNPIPTPSPSHLSLYYPNASFGPLGSFSIKSPINQTYENNSVMLIIGGEILADPKLNPTISYSVDSQQINSISFTPKPSSIFPSVLISCSICLPQLSSGEHTVTVYGHINDETFSNAQANVTFAIR